MSEAPEYPPKLPAPPKLGKWVTKRIYNGSSDGNKKQGRVVYVHPSELWYTAEFYFEKGSYRQSFFVFGGE